MKERNFQCSDCGLCFQDNEEGARLAKEHRELTGHNEDLINLDVSEILEQALENLSKIQNLRADKQ